MAYSAGPSKEILEAVDKDIATETEIPTQFQQVTGREKRDYLNRLHGKLEHYESHLVANQPFGTDANPFRVYTAYNQRIVGCQGQCPGAAEPGWNMWMLMHVGGRQPCPECGQVFELLPKTPETHEERGVLMHRQLDDLLHRFSVRMQWLQESQEVSVADKETATKGISGCINTLLFYKEIVQRKGQWEKEGLSDDEISKRLSTWSNAFNSSIPAFEKASPAEQEQISKKWIGQTF